MVYVGELCAEYSFGKPKFIVIQAGVPCKWVNDSQRLLLEYFDIIHESPSQIYHSALPFCPSSSWLQKYYSVVLSQEVKVVKGLPAGWGTCSHTVLLDSSPQALVCQKDTIAVSLESSNIIILDGITGGQVATLSGHTDWVRSLAFSLDGALLVSGSDDKSVKLWDVQTGGVVGTFHGHTGQVFSISIAVDHTMIASGSNDKTIHLWDVQTGRCHHVIQQQEQVECVSFSPTDPQHLMSAAGDKVWQWDTNGHQIHPTYNGSHIVFSPDCTKVVSTQEASIVIQNSNSGTIVGKFHVANIKTNCCCFSPDNQLIAIAVDNTIHIWNITVSDPHIVETFVGHTSYITSLTFSSPSSLISASRDQSIKFWKIDTLPTGPVLTSLESKPLTSALVKTGYHILKTFVGHTHLITSHILYYLDKLSRLIGALLLVPVLTNLKSTPLTLAPIKSITLQAKDGIAISGDSAGVVRIWDISTGLCKASLQTPAKGHCESDVRLIGSRLILVWYMKKKIHVWDVEKGKLLQMVDGPVDNVEDVRISGDGSKVFCLCWRSIQAWSIQTGEVMGKVGLKYCKHQRSLTVDDSRVWVHSPLSEPWGWDFGVSGTSPTVTLPHLSDTKLWDISQSRVKDTVTGQVVFQLAGRFANPVNTQWDGQYLVAGYESGEVLILDFYHTLPW